MEINPFNELYVTFAVGTFCALISLMLLKKLPKSSSIFHYTWTSVIIGVFACYPYIVNLFTGTIELHFLLFCGLLYSSIFIVTLTVNSITIPYISTAKLVLISMCFGSTLYMSIILRDFMMVENLQDFNLSLLVTGMILSIGTSLAMIRFVRYLRELDHVKFSTLLFASLAIGIAFGSLYFTIESTSVFQEWETIILTDRIYLNLAFLPWTLSVLSLVLIDVAPILLEESRNKKKAANELESIKRIEFLSHYDALTNLPNRNLFLSKLEELIHQNTPAVLLFFDLDRFKTINDVLGHSTGDKLLIQVTDRLKRIGDEEVFIARIGGDEFAILLMDYSMEEVENFVIRGMNTIKEPFYVDEHQLYITGSIGGTKFQDGKGTAEELMKQADTAMTRAKEKGKNTYEFFNKGRDVDILERLQLENDLRKGLEENQFELFYQPQVSVKTKMVESFEVLLRWRHPKKGIISPNIFIPIAEELLIINDIGKWVLQEACKQLKQWHTSGNPGLKISVNVSLVQFYEKDFIPSLKRCLVENSLDSSFLHIEITETMAMKDLQQTILITKQLQQLGVGLSIDDFGKGYSSLSHIRDIPLDCLKIDGSFIRDLPHSKEAAVIIRTITAMAHSLDLVIVAEQVEEEPQVQFLQSVHCDYIQGYYYGKPLPPEEAILSVNMPVLV
ncbi:putative bifunctional diguanylate cyclase/phosphodiesterase [Bacillus sp. SCS-153A]|uniref:putative bifunctional diguanylate cyclase/phosphodiesterase n=1 Tax=Rossellomorea sedimentorum TaxID=3115294 RepID=UPI003906CDB5